MDKNTGVIRFGLLLRSVRGCQQQGNNSYPSDNTAEDDEAAIKAWYDQKTEVTNAGDVEGLKVLFTDDVIFMPPGGDLFQGWQTYHHWAGPFFDEHHVKENISYEEVGVNGDWAYIRTFYTMESTPKAGGETTVAKGKAIWLFRRQADGTWKGSHCIWNENNPQNQE